MWDKYMHSYKLMVEGLSGNTDKTVQKSVDMYKDAIELLELKMYESNIMFNEDGGISVKIPPNYFGRYFIDTIKLYSKCTQKAKRNPENPVFSRLSGIFHFTPIL